MKINTNEKKKCWRLNVELDSDSHLKLHNICYSDLGYQSVYPRQYIRDGLNNVIVNWDRVYVAFPVRCAESACPLGKENCEEDYEASRARARAEEELFKG